MKNNKEEFVKWSKDLIQQGFDKAPMFCAEKGCDAAQLIRILIHPCGEPTREQALIATGGVLWALSQLGGQDEP